MVVEGVPAPHLQALGDLADGRRRLFPQAGRERDFGRVALGPLPQILLPPPQPAEFLGDPGLCPRPLALPPQGPGMIRPQLPGHILPLPPLEGTNPSPWPSPRWAGRGN